ncbi:MAG: peptidylprolyl isomerase [ANME-2 cluster archaeon]|nr:peptidylprolyl isomerase [ANME-2 cluster archaeon]
MVKVENDDTVKIHYELKLKDGTVYESTLNQEPVKFRIGNNETIIGLEQALLGLNEGESKTFKVPFEKGFGSYQRDLVVTIDRDDHPYLEPEIGQMLTMTNPDGTLTTVKVADFSDSTVTLDANHPLAGEDLIFDIQLLEIFKNK